jgi:hypothetical protein
MPMRLYLDNNYQPGIFKIISQIHSLQSPQQHEVVYRNWKNEYSSNDTIVFLINLNKKSIDRAALGYYNDGYKVFVYRKPYDAGFDPYVQVLAMMIHWRKILNAIEEQESPYIYSISDHRIKQLK